MTTTNTKEQQIEEIRSAVIAYAQAYSRFSAINSKISQYEAAHGFGYEDDYDDDAYDEFTEHDPVFNALWSMCDEELDLMNEFSSCAAHSIKAYTDGQVDYLTARKLVTEPTFFERIRFIFAA